MCSDQAKNVKIVKLIDLGINLIIYVMSRV